ncbi:MAG: MFS transporter [Ignavibacteriales bacterium]|nr:MFS transporter [Ignavibacteriales bacterium]
MAMAAESAPRERMARAIGLVQTAQRLGPALGPVIGGVVAEMVGIRRAFFVTAGFYAVALAVVFLLYRRPGAGRRPRWPRRRAGGGDVAAAAQGAGFLLMMAAIFAHDVRRPRASGPILPLYLAARGRAVERGRAALGRAVLGRRGRRGRRQPGSASGCCDSGAAGDGHRRRRRPRRPRALSWFLAVAGGAGDGPGPAAVRRRRGRGHHRGLHGRRPRRARRVARHGVRVPDGRLARGPRAEPRARRPAQQGAHLLAVFAVGPGPARWDRPRHRAAPDAPIPSPESRIPAASEEHQRHQRERRNQHAAATRACSRRSSASARRAPSAIDSTMKFGALPM